MPSFGPIPVRTRSTIAKEDYVLGVSWIVLVLVPLAALFGYERPGGLLAYVGLGPGQEFIPYFFGLLAWAGAAFLAILQWPLFALLRRFRRDREVQKEPAPPPEKENVPVASAEGSPDRS
jgi:hypothetical protein